MEPNAGASTGTQTETVSAERAAAERGDVTAFLDASRDRRQGKAPAAVTREKATETTPDKPAAGAGRTVTGRDGAPAKGPAEKDREADERLTARIREAVDTSTRELRTKNEELARELATLKGSARPAGERAATGGQETEASKRAALTAADIKRYQDLPGAPKLDDKDAKGEFLYETPSQHAIALADFIRDTKAAERQQTERGAADRVERTKREAARVTAFADRIEQYRTSHPDLLVDNGKGEKVALPLSKEMAGLHGYAALKAINDARQQAGEQPLPATVDHAIAEEIYDSEICAHVAVYLSQHPDELNALRKATTPAQLSRLFGRLEAKVLSADASAAAVFSTGAKDGGQRADAGAAATEARAANSKNKPTVDARREAQEAVDRSVSSAKPLNGNLGQPGAAGVGDPEERAVKSGDVTAFLDIQRQRRQELLTGRSRR